MVTVAILGGGLHGPAHAANYRALGDRVRVKTVASRTPSAPPGGGGRRRRGDERPRRGDPRPGRSTPSTSACRHRSTASTRSARSRAGKHVFLEKPIALTLEDADAIVAAAARSGRGLHGRLVLRFWPEYVELQRLVAAGELGRPRAVSRLPALAARGLERLDGRPLAVRRAPPST